MRKVTAYALRARRFGCLPSQAPARTGCSTKTHRCHCPRRMTGRRRKPDVRLQGLYFDTFAAVVAPRRAASKILQDGSGALFLKQIHIV
jgi:hypothetical protein